MGVKIVNGAWATLGSSLTNIATTINLTAGHGARFGTIASPDFMYVTLIKASSGETEHVKITNRSTDTLTVTRAQDGSSAIAFDAGDRIECRPINAVLQEFLQLKEGGTIEKGLAVGTVSGVLQFPDGSASAPGLRTGSSSTTGIFGNGDNSVRVACNTSQEAIFSTAGLQLTNLLNLSASTAGQIQFPASQNASANANTLDDYEEGTWTPVVKFGGATTGITYGSQLGYYTKIGNRFLVDAVIQLSNKGSATGAATIDGLPGTVFSLTACAIRINSLASGGIGGAPSAIFNNSGTTVALQSLSDTATGVVNITDAMFTNTTDVILGGNFRI